MNLSKNYSLFHVAMAITAFFTLSPYFAWHDKTYYRVAGIITLIIYICVLLNRNIKIKISNLLFTFLFALFLIYSSLPKEVGTLRISLLIYPLMLIFILSDDKDKVKAYNLFSLIFAYSLIPGIILAMLFLFGIEPQWKYLEPLNPLKTGYYMQYFGAVIYNSSFDFINFQTITRLHGMFDEAGVVGTMCGLLLIGNNFKTNRNPINILLLLGGILSFSLAFYLLMFYYLLASKSLRGSMIFILILAIIIILVGNVVFEKKIVDRLRIKDGWIAGDTRTTSSFDYEFNKFLSGSKLDLIFGLGRSASSDLNMQGSSSWKSLVYDYGIFGFLFLGILLISYYYSMIRSKEGLFFLIAFLLSMYQRPGIINLHYFIIFFGGLHNLKNISSYYNKNITEIKEK